MNYLPVTTSHAPTFTHSNRLALLSMLFLFGLALLFTQTTQAEIYRVVDEDGNVSYTDQPRPDEASEASSVEVDDDSNVSDSPKTIQDKEPAWVREAREERERNARKDDDEEEEELDDYEQWKLDVKEARKAVREAKQNLEEGREPGEGDYVGYRSASGGSGARPSSEYLERVENLEKNVQQAERKLKKLLRNKP